MNKFAERLKEVLAIRGISQNKLAKKLEVGQKTVNNWCCGNHEPNFDMLLLICQELEEEPNYLLGWVD